MATSQKTSLLAEALTATKTGDTKGLSSKDKAFIGILSVSACNAATTVNAKIQHSADGSTWFDLVSFTAVVGTTGAELKQITTSVLHKVRAVVTLAGATQTATVDLALWLDPDR